MRPTDRVLLGFSGMPPAEVQLAGKTHTVVLHAGSPLICYRCQRYGHKAATCRNDALCRRCGRSSHQATECKNTPKCANCKGPHAASAPNCPLRAFEAEKRKALMKDRLVQKLEASHPDVLIQTVSSYGQPATTQATPETESSGELSASKRTYAAVLLSRSVVVDTLAGPEVRVNLPGPAPIPKTLRKIVISENSLL